MEENWNISWISSSGSKKFTQISFYINSIRMLYNFIIVESYENYSSFNLHRAYENYSWMYASDLTVKTESAESSNLEMLKKM